ncbi:MAG: glutathione S-transferase N-terminal domain-containing protein [Rhodobacteraceae bacterium]|nr:glutathione S-transferase N-terminal domain-containing protein [Paracoccaceae bacterium]
MADLSAFPINARWPARNPDILQLYSWPTPNGVKVSIALEEMGLPYEAHTVTLTDADVKSAAFTSLNPNGKIPAIIDPDGPEGKPIGMFESGAILIYLAEKTGQLMPTGSRKYEVLQWLMFQMGGIGPFFGQLGWFHKFAGKDIEDPRPKARYVAEAKRLLTVLDGALAGREWIAGAYSIADIAIVPWLRGFRDLYEAGDLVGLDTMTNVNPYIDRFLARAAVQRGLVQPPRD